MNNPERSDPTSNGIEWKLTNNNKTGIGITSNVTCFKFTYYLLRPLYSPCSLPMKHCLERITVYVIVFSRYGVPSSISLKQ